MLGTSRVCQSCRRPVVATIRCEHCGHLLEAADSAFNDAGSGAPSVTIVDLRPSYDEPYDDEPADAVATDNE